MTLLALSLVAGDRMILICRHDKRHVSFRVFYSELRRRFHVSSVSESLAFLIPTWAISGWGHATAATSDIAP